MLLLRLISVEKKSEIGRKFERKIGENFESIADHFVAFSGRQKKRKQQQLQQTMVISFNGGANSYHNHNNNNFIKTTEFFLLFAGLLCCFGFASSTSPLYASSTIAPVLVDCNGTSYEYSQGVTFFNKSTILTNCFFNNSQLLFSTSHLTTSLSPSHVLSVQNCSFANSTLLVEGDVSHVEVMSTRFISESTLRVQSKTARVIITTSIFMNSNYNYPFPSFDEPDDAMLAIVGSRDVLIKGCNFTNNNYYVAVKLLETQQSLITDSNFENNWMAVYSTSKWTKISRSNFYNQTAGANTIYTSGQGLTLDVEDCNFFDNVYSDHGVIVSWADLTVTRSVFRNNIITEKYMSYEPNGAAITTLVMPDI